MIDGDKKNYEFCKNIMQKFSTAVDCCNLFVDNDNVESLQDVMLYLNPDVFSLDIDGNDYYIA